MLHAGFDYWLAKSANEKKKKKKKDETEFKKKAYINKIVYQ